jgi:hypothetical protein
MKHVGNNLMGERIMEGMNLITVLFMRGWKYHNETPFVQLMYANFES